MPLYQEALEAVSGGLTAAATFIRLPDLLGNTHFVKRLWLWLEVILSYNYL
jgi:hypothetical protein